MAILLMIQAAGLLLFLATLLAVATSGTTVASIGSGTALGGTAGALSLVFSLPVPAAGVLAGALFIFGFVYARELIRTVRPTDPAAASKSLRVSSNRLPG